uniref:Uncharacterized protein n=1 Tax=Glossina austeni TaxID=7395 RepID=A0A1A9V4X3_GLOAU
MVIHRPAWPITKYVHKLFAPFVKFKIDYLRFIWLGSSHQIFTAIRLPKSLHFKLSQLQFCVQHRLAGLEEISNIKIICLFLFAVLIKLIKFFGTLTETGTCQLVQS